MERAARGGGAAATIAPDATDLLSKASSLAEKHVERTDAAHALADLANGHRKILEDAYLEHLKRMQRLPSNDFHATAVLRVVEQALALVPRTVRQPNATAGGGGWPWSRRRRNRE